MRKLVIQNDRGEFFNGDWERIRWTPEYPEARVYHVHGLAKRRTRKLRAELDDPSIRLVEDYGLESQRDVGC